MATEKRVASLAISDEARSVLRAIADDRDGSVAVVLNDGCCDGMGPVAIDEAMVGSRDVRLGSADGIDVYVPESRAASREGYAIAIDIDEREGVGSFSLEVPRGYRLTADEQRVG
ncbi:MAG: DUF779 domain-containing protein [Euryarchaeota archaeon]|nr:DUF779 domain-containing protein [Euryarchaeota archaeon]